MSKDEQLIQVKMTNPAFRILTCLLTAIGSPNAKTLRVRLEMAHRQSPVSYVKVELEPHLLESVYMLIADFVAEDASSVEKKVLRAFIRHADDAIIKDCREFWESDLKALSYEIGL